MIVLLNCKPTKMQQTGRSPLVQLTRLIKQSWFGHGVGFNNTGELESQLKGISMPPISSQPLHALMIMECHQHSHTVQCTRCDVRTLTHMRAYKCLHAFTITRHKSHYRFSTHTRACMRSQHFNWICWCTLVYDLRRATSIWSLPTTCAFLLHHKISRVTPCSPVQNIF